jgi:mono/diheme cytochrome c family protein
MTRTHKTTTVMVLAMAAFSGALLSAMAPAGQDGPVRSENVTPEKKKARVERGAHLVRTMGCNDCHTPWKMGPKGPEPDMSRALTGHPSDMVMPPAPSAHGPWIGHSAATNTAFAGPWGVSFTANLTPDKDTGLGAWTEDMFIATVRTGRHQGKGRPILPPMPYWMVGALEDEDIKSIFAYLQSLAPVKNRVPAPIEPVEDKK